MRGICKPTGTALLILGLWLTLGTPQAAQAQDALRLVDQDTRVRSVDFRFLGRHVMDEDQLAAQIVTQGPSFGDRLKRRFSFLPFIEPDFHRFDPVELQRDMARLRRYYERNGFLRPRIDYPASQFRDETNRIRVIINVDEGPPLAVASKDIRTSHDIARTDSSAWQNLLERAPLQIGDRFTEFQRLQLESRVRSFWRNRGFAFADVATDLQVDSTASQVNLSLRANLGPPTVIDSIRVEGIESVDRHVVTRELPFSPGDTFSENDLVAGQRSLFGLNLFRVALVEVPDQTRDSTVTVLVRLREARPRYLEIQTGYSREDGLEAGTTLRHRNFLGDARQFSISGSAQTGRLATPPAERIPVEEYTAGVSVSQPFFFRRNLSLTVGVDGSVLDDQNQDTHYRRVGVTPSLLYTVLPFRAVTLQYRISQAEPLDQNTSLGRLGIFSRDVVATSVTAGRLNNYLNPRRGWIVRPSAELAGTLLPNDIAYHRGSLDAFGYIPITRRSSIAVTLRVGRLVPTGPSRDQNDPDTEFRFDDIRYYAGGANDVRGWGLNAIGPQIARADTVIANADGTFDVQNARFEAVGGLGKLAGSIEFIFPAPLLGSSWRAATFVDFGGLPSRVARDADGRILLDANRQPLVRDGAFPSLSDLRWAAGTGLRLQTPVGAVRLDLAYKLNPNQTDLQKPADRVLFNRGLAPEPNERQWRRLNVHLSITRAF
ncbi:MAG: BamA/TamA family outer membrane protein [Rhodothermales bacterium]|nr:BamA/TamA family outer membrane protein [Rhodothermales bacterium]MBO6778018.1 BamA/TamA family outer membrane protein [Rhodothermales bacterium]